MSSDSLKSLAIACSPRKGGNTEIMAGSALDGAINAGASGEILFLRDFRYAPCVACDGCFKNGRCVVKDDATQIFDKILKTDVLILAAPIFSMGLCAQAKMLIDRAQQFWACKYILQKKVVEDDEKRKKRRGIFISASGTDLPGVFDGAVRVVRYFFTMLDINIAGTYCYSKIDRKGDVLKREDILAQVYKAGEKLVK